MTQPNIASPRRTATLEIGGQDVVLAYADERAEYDALRSGAVVVDRSHRGRLRVFGEKSGEALTGLVTNDVLAMLPGNGRYGAPLFVALLAKTSSLGVVGCRDWRPIPPVRVCVHSVNRP